MLRSMTCSNSALSGLAGEGVFAGLYNPLFGQIRYFSPVARRL